jgi:predicted nuclease of predicted toxin-antitoxin system
LKRRSPTEQPPSDRPTSFRLLLDENVPDSVGDVFEEAGHLVIRHRDVLRQGVSDDVVALTALIEGAVLVSIDRDMTQLTGPYGRIAQAFTKLHLIKIGCPEPQAAARIREAMTFLVCEWHYQLEKPVRRMFVQIRAHELRTYR